MSETRTYYPDGSLKRLVVDNRDKSLSLSIEDLTREIPNSVAKVTYQEFDVNNVQTFTITRTRTQLLNTLSTYSYIYDFVYYANGNINTIRIRTYDASAVLLKDRTIKHYQNGARAIEL